MFDSDQWKKMRSDHSLELSIFHVNRWMTWRQVKKMSSSSLNISAWLTSHYFFEHCSHVSQYLKRLFYLISFHQLLNDIVDVMKMFWYQRSWRVANFSTTCNHDSHTEIDFFTRYFFIFYWHQHVINLLRKSIVTVRKNVVA